MSMLSGLAHHVRLRLQAETGVNAGVVTLGAIAAACGVLAVLFLCIAAFVWIANRSDALTAGLTLGLIFLAATVIAAVLCIYWGRRVARVARAEAAAASRQSASMLLDPRLLALGLQLGRSIGLRRLAPVAAVGLLAALGSREWFAHAEPRSQPQQPR